MGTDTFESNVKKTAEAKNIVAYKEYFEGTSKYFDQINTMQLNQLKNRKKMLAKLGDNIKDKKIIEQYAEFKEKKDDNININDNNKQENNDEEIDLTFYSKERDNFKNLKEAVETLIKESKDKQVTTILKKLLAEITPIIKVKGEILKSFGLNTRHEELLNRYTQLKNISESDDYDESDLDSLLNKKSNSNNNEKLDHEKSDNDNSEDLDGYDSGNSDDEESEDLDNELSSEDEDEYDNNNSEGSDDELYSEDDDDFENFDGESDNSDNEYGYNMVKILSSKEQNDEKDIKLMENNTKTNDTNVNNNNDNKINNEIDESQYEYELRRTDYINEIEAKLMNAAGIINAIIESQELQKKQNGQKKKIEKAKKNEKKVKKIEKTNDKLDDKIPINKDICVFLLKLLRTKETSINTKAIKDIMMINKIVEMADFEGYREKNENNADEYEKIMLETMFEDSSIYKTKDKDKDKNKDDASTLARFLFRLYYVVSHNARVGTIKETNRQGPKKLTSDDFCTSYKEICVGVEQGKFVNALEKLSDMVDKEMTKQNSNKKLYDTIKKYLNELKNPEAKTHIDEAISEINRSCDNKLLKEHINTKSNIFKKDEYFKIDKTIYNSEKYEEKIANKPANDNLKKETSNENKETTANNNTTNPA